MDSVKTRIDEIQKDMDSAWSELRRQAYRLASLAGHLEDGPLTLISPSLRIAFLDAERSFNAVNSRKMARDELEKRLSEGQAPNAMRRWRRLLRLSSMRTDALSRPPVPAGFQVRSAGRGFRCT